jgi:pimeloyl-ACP methyl ester carboxylesterase
MAPERTTPEPVLLLHGIWLVGSTLKPLARRLAAAGFEPMPMTWPSITGGPEAAVDLVRAKLRALAGRGPVHLVGHSLGGLVALEAMRDATDLPPGRVVCLGSPLAGSRAARSLARVPGARQLTGRSHEALCRGACDCPAGREVGSIAGRVPLGIGALWAGLEGPHDGTVAVAETRLPGLADHCIVAASHSGLLLSAEAARRTVAFLRHGRFDPEAEPAG